MARLSGNRELIFSIGGEEVLANITPGGTIKFTNPQNLSQLDDIDLLSIKLYQANDAANILWQYDFAGIYAYYKIPHVTRWLKKTKASPADNKEFRILGGMRIRLEYAAQPDEQNIINYEWSLSPAGQFKKDFKFAAPVVTDTNKDTVYWEPNEWRTDHNINGILKIIYIDNKGAQQSRTKTFNVTSRVLEPKAAGSEMEGTDVAMLEELLWQLGVSPQKGSPGSEGARINSDRGKNKKGNPLGFTKNCANKDADRRDIYYTGWSTCSDSQVSLEAMVRRFTARNTEIGAVVSSGDVSKASSIVNEATTLAWLKRDWGLYSSTVDKFTDPAYEIYSQDDAEMPAWIIEAVEIWQSGLGNGARVPPTLTDTVYDRVLEQAGLAKGSRTREALLKAWLEEETEHHWGSNVKAYQPTKYRMTEGGADENGSLSYSQLLYHYRYGSKPCIAHKDAGLNLYHPRDNLKTMVIHTASNATSSTNTASCVGRLFRAFIGGNQSLRVAYNHGSSTSGESMDELVGYIKNSSVQTLAVTNIEDDYEALAKGIAIYNSNGPNKLNWFPTRSWPRLLRYLDYDKLSKENTPTTCHSCRYSIQVRNKPGVLLNQLRSYVWAGARDASGVPVWCFAFGEKEWVSGKSFVKVNNAAKDKNSLGKKQIPVGRINCITGVSIP